MNSVWNILKFVHSTNPQTAKHDIHWIRTNSLNSASMMPNFKGNFKIKLTLQTGNWLRQTERTNILYRQRNLSLAPTAWWWVHVLPGFGCLNTAPLSVSAPVFTCPVQWPGATHSSRHSHEGNKHGRGLIFTWKVWSIWNGLFQAYLLWIYNCQKYILHNINHLKGFEFSFGLMKYRFYLQKLLCL